MKNEGISVIICCHNSGWIISRTLNALLEQTLPTSLSMEIILVDNNCNDNTTLVAQELMSKSVIPFNVVIENRPGLVYARRKGIDNVRYDIVTFCDDDNILCRDYLSTMYSILQSDKTIGATGGKGIAEFGGNPEGDIANNLSPYAVGSQCDGRKDWLYGAGLTVRTKLVRDIYDNQHCYLVGRQGKTTLSGDDTELVLSIVNRGYKISPTDDVYYTHVLKDSRLTLEYYKELNDSFLLPVIAFKPMRAAIYETGFVKVYLEYLLLKVRYIRHMLSFWEENRKVYCFEIKNEYKRYEQWGLRTLFEIYLDWRSIHAKWCK